MAIVDKRRSSALKTSQENIIGGPIEGKVVQEDGNPVVPGAPEKEGEPD